MVGAGTWTGSQLDISSTGSVDLCAIGGLQLAGFIDGNNVIVKIYRATEGTQYNTELTWDQGTGKFGDPIQRIINLTLQPNF